MQVFNGKIAIDKNDGETASTVSGATANTKMTGQKASEKQQQANQNNFMSRLSGFSPNKPSVGFKLEEGDSPDPKGVQLDNVLGAIENGETDGIRAIASLKDIGG